MVGGIEPRGIVRSVSLNGRGGLLLKDANGTFIEPAEIGPPPEFAATKMTRRQDNRATEYDLQKRGCKKSSWRGGDVLTRPADNVQIVLDSVVGRSSLSVTSERTQSYTTSMILGIAGIIILGVGADFTESVSSGKCITVTIPEGQSEKLGFTATLSCSTRKGKCKDGKAEGEVCCKCLPSVGFE